MKLYHKNGCDALIAIGGGKYGTPHGLVNAVIMPYVLESYGKCAYKKLHRLGVAAGVCNEIFCVTITSGLSGSYNSACVAKRVYESENEGKRVHVFDTLSAGPEITLIIEKIEEYIEMGKSFDEIRECAEAYMQKTGLVFMLKKAVF